MRVWEKTSFCAFTGVLGLKAPTPASIAHPTLKNLARSPRTGYGLPRFVSETKVTPTTALSGDLQFLHYSTARPANRAFLPGVSLSTRLIDGHRRSLHAHYSVHVVYRTRNRTKTVTGLRNVPANLPVRDTLARRTAGLRKIVFFRSYKKNRLVTVSSQPLFE